MKLKQLQYFRELAKNEHYALTAEQLQIAQPSLSRIISSLEDELGTYLFEKHGRNIRLTKYGKIYLEYVERALDELELGYKKLDSIVNPTRGTIDLGVIYTLGPQHLPQLIKRFYSKKENENYNFNFYQGNSIDLLKSLKTGEYDLALCSYILKEPEINFEYCFSIEFVAIVSNDHPLAKYDKTNLKELSKYPFILPSDKTSYIDTVFKKANLKLNVVCRVQEDHAITGLVSVNFGISIVPRNISLENYNIKILEIEGGYAREVYIATLKDRFLAPPPQAFKNFILNNKEDF